MLMTIGLVVYMSFYTFESPIRYVFNMMGMDSLIFIRDVCIVIPLLLIFMYQIFTRKVHIAFYVYLFIVIFHGFIIVYNAHSAMAGVFGAKLLITCLVGAIAARTFFEPGRKFLLFILMLWSVTCVGVAVEKYLVDFPWIGMEATVGGMKVEISRDWQTSGADKRAAGFTRASINTAHLVGLIALILMFHLNVPMLRWFIGLVTLVVLYWTTQKGAILVFGILLGLLAILPRRPVMAMKFGLFFMLALDIGLPVMMPGYYMDKSEGMFSLYSFNIRVEDMWPRAWHWIDSAELFPFGVGLGGLGGGQRFFAPYAWDAADNLFILLYAYFGFLGLIYIFWTCLAVLRVKKDAPNSAVHALATIMFIVGYGVVISIIEDQMGSLFLGASLGWLYEQLRRQREEKPLEEDYYPAIAPAAAAQTMLPAR